MLIANPVFVENTEYAYAVARVRALETKLIDQAGFSALLAAAPDKFAGALAEAARIKVAGTGGPELLLSGLEESFTQTFLAVKSLLLEVSLKRLVSLKYDYEIVKFIVKEERGGAGSREAARVPTELSKRSNYSYPLLKTLLEGGKATETGQTMMRAYLALKKLKELTGRVVDDACDSAYFAEAFSILEGCGNDFLDGYFKRQVDAVNILTMLRLKARKEKRAAFRERFLPFGSIDVPHLEAGLELSMEGLAAKLAFNPFSAVIRGAAKGGDEWAQAVALERAFEEELLKYLKESMFVTFGVEPVLAYLWVRENEVKNLRTILLSKASGLSPDEIRRHLRGFHG
jgi:V/A-type H+-transporting ATPase subunit C